MIFLGAGKTLFRVNTPRLGQYTHGKIHHLILFQIHQIWVQKMHNTLNL